MRTIYLVFLAIVALATFVSVPSSTLVAYWPWLLVLACPLMHFFMHHGHGHHGQSSTPKGE